MLAMSAVKWILASEKSAAVVSTCPLKVLNLPVTVVITRCLALNEISLCRASITQEVLVAVKVSMLFVV
jgi:hypothetical protein